MLTWTCRPMDLGRVRLDVMIAGVSLCLELYDGGGYCPGHGLWRVAGRLVAIVPAGQA